MERERGTRPKTNNIKSSMSKNKTVLGGKRELKNRGNMGRLWKRASGALKDSNSILAASLARKTAHRHPEVELSVIKATSHDDTKVNYDAARVVFRLICTSPVCFRAFLWALSHRMERTCSWAVALKGVILMHGALALGCDSKAVRTIGRLPFDLSNFSDGHGNPKKMWGFNDFVRAYYAFVDQKSALMSVYLQERKAQSKYAKAESKTESSMLPPLVWLQRLQGLLDLLLQIQPQTQGMNEAVLIREAMDCVIIDVYGIHRKICNGIAEVLLNICSAGRTEASMALQILHKSREQGEEISMFIERCKEMKVANALQYPRVEQVPERDFWEVERMVSGVSEADTDCSVFETGKVVVAVREDRVAGREGDSKRMKTVITNEWEVFEEDLIKFSGEIGSGDMGRRRRRRNGGEEEDPFAASLVPIPYQAYVKNQEVPDLISFL